MATRRVSFRTRPVAVDQQITILRTAKEVEEHGMLNENLLLRTLGGKDNLAVIPVPSNFKNIKFKGAVHGKTYRPPAKYIEKGVAPEHNETIVHYDLQEEDIAFVEGLPEQHRAALDADTVEFLMDRLEKSHQSMDNVSSAQAITTVRKRAHDYFDDERFPKLRAACDDPTHIDVVVKYWLDRRKKLKHQLLYSLIPPPPDARNGDPYLAFRARDIKTRRQPIRTRRTQAETLSAYKRSQEQLKRFKDVVGYIVEREKIKRQILNVNMTVFLERRRLLLSGLHGIPSIDALAYKFRASLPPMPFKRQRDSMEGPPEATDCTSDADLAVQIPMLYIGNEDAEASSGSEDERERYPSLWRAIPPGNEHASKLARVGEGRRSMWARVGRGGRILVYPSRRPTRVESGAPGPLGGGARSPAPAFDAQHLRSRGSSGSRPTGLPPGTSAAVIATTAAATASASAKATHASA